MSNSPPTGSAHRTFRKYDNFRDPAGLILRMLKSGHPAARGAILRAALSIGAVPFDWLLERREKRRLAMADLDAPTPPLVLLVGPPRSGSTLLYQILARHTDVSYFSNLTALFPRAPITATNLLQGSDLSGGGDFNSFYGQTAGMAAPNDGFEVWNRWLGEDRYDVCQSLDEETTQAMRRFFAAWTDEFRRPLLNKNNRNADCLHLLADTLPQATFVVIRRDPLFVAQSLIESRLRVQGAKDRPWGLASQDDHTEADEPLGYVDDVCDQLIAIESKLQQQQTVIEPNRVIEVTYESLCDRPQETVEQVVASVPELQIRDEHSFRRLEPFTISSRMRMSVAEVRRVESRIAESPLLSGNNAPQHSVVHEGLGQRFLGPIESETFVNTSM